MSDKFCGVREVIVNAIHPFLYLDPFNRGVAKSGVRVTDEHGYEEANEVRFVSG
jgi:hypothetical protein